jgi:hypothetical protein
MIFIVSEMSTSLSQRDNVPVPERQGKIDAFRSYVKAPRMAACGEKAEEPVVDRAVSILRAG